MEADDIINIISESLDIIGSTSQLNQVMHRTMTYIIQHIVKQIKTDYAVIGTIESNSEDKKFYRYHAIHYIDDNHPYLNNFTQKKYLDNYDDIIFYGKLVQNGEIQKSDDLARDHEKLPDNHPNNAPLHYH